uniref:4-amino-4-deoxy-L-arabinose transferase-like protein n=1 Tax=uncultured bacterium CSL11 TaxID=1091566 RepID=G4WVD1_9BACT|nr:4-amino-4-deoxy-L-arabinose transferase-like protein [uncultured bacterium CSL11]
MQVLAETDSDQGFALSPSGPYRALKQLGLVVLCVTWALLGTFGHDPWKTEDATAFGIAYEMMQRGDVLVPQLAGEAFVERPPLVYAAAAAAATAFSPILPMPDAARLAAAVVLVLTMLLVAATAAELCGRDFQWMAVLLFIGSVGLWDRAHQLSPEQGLMLGVATALYGFALALRRPVAGGAILGLGIAISFLSRGLLGPLWIGVTALALPAAFRTWRTARYGLAIAVALAIAVPAGAGWPLTLAYRAPDHLQAWWAMQSLSDYFSPLAISASGDPTYLLKNLPWFAWPALPLVLWTLWTRGRGFNGGLATPGVQLLGMLSLVIAISMLAKTEPRAIELMPMLVPLSLLGALEVDTLKRGFSGALDWFGILTFGLLSALVWWLWFDAYAFGMSPAVAKLFRDTEAGYRPPFGWTALVVSALLTVLWLLLVRPARRSNRRAVLNWAAGMTLLWALFTTIWLPYLDSRRSYRTVAESVRSALPREGCVASRNLGEAQRALFNYFANLVTVREEKQPINRCPALLVQYGRHDADTGTPAGWEAVWDGHRRGDDTERYVLYVRKAP